MVFTFGRAFAPAVLATLLAGCAVPGALSYGARSDELFGRIHAGMTGDEVRSLIGVPDETMPFPLSHTLAWDYRYQDTWGYIVIFSVTFGADGRVVAKLSRRVNDGGDHSG